MYQEGCVQFADFKEFVHSIICWKGSNFLSCFYCVFLRTGWSLWVWKEGFDKQIRIDILQIKIIAFKSWKTNISIRVLIIEGNSEASKLNIEAFTAYFMRALLLAHQKQLIITFLWLVFKKSMAKIYNIIIFFSF